MAIFAPRMHVSLNVPEQFGKQTANITQALTLTLLFRSGGAAIFGVLSGPLSSTSGSSRSSSSVPKAEGVDVTKHGHGFCDFNRPVGLASGVLQQGYAVGYLVGPPFVGISGMGGDFGELGIAAVISLELVLTVHVGWRSLFWTASGIGVFGACLCALLPESRILVKASFLSHGSQDLYGFNPHTANDYWELGAWCVSVGSFSLLCPILVYSLPYPHALPLHQRWRFAPTPTPSRPSFPCTPAP
ncbi:hypothetical protein B0H14DRAFT_3867630 [Mycena olivaceomarginata]|nr:hypothetical protein B0H14DRAFT_3867630 [Mycena olivaceomarginata]